MSDLPIGDFHMPYDEWTALAKTDYWAFAAYGWGQFGMLWAIAKRSRFSFFTYGRGHDWERIWIGCRP